jgi:hypothetical protein
MNIRLNVKCALIDVEGLVSLAGKFAAMAKDDVANCDRIEILQRMGKRIEKQLAEIVTELEND